MEPVHIRKSLQRGTVPAKYRSQRVGVVASTHRQDTLAHPCTHTRYNSERYKRVFHRLYFTPPYEHQHKHRILLWTIPISVSKEESNHKTSISTPFANILQVQTVPEVCVRRNQTSQKNTKIGVTQTQTPKRSLTNTSVPPCALVKTCSVKWLERSIGDCIGVGMRVGRQVGIEEERGRTKGTQAGKKTSVTVVE